MIAHDWSPADTTTVSQPCTFLLALETDMPDGLDDFPDGFRHLLRGFKVHVVSALEDDLLAVGGEPCESSLTVFALPFQLGDGKIKIIAVTTLRPSQNDERNCSQRPGLFCAMHRGEILGRPFALAVFGIFKVWQRLRPDVQLLYCERKPLIQRTNRGLRRPHS